MAELSPLSGPVNQFSIGLFHRLSLDAGQENVFLSPFSVSTALSMLLLGAKNESESQLRNGLCFDKLDEKDGTTVHKMFAEMIERRIKSNSSVFLSNYVLIQKENGDNQVLGKYKSNLQALYAAKLDDVNFAEDGPQIMATVNEWVKESTKGLIKTILDSAPDVDTKLILLNAIYFKGKWETPFEKDMTVKMPFYNRGSDDTVETAFMTMYDTKFLHANEKIGGQDAQILELDYMFDNMSMIIVLPENRNGLTAILSSDAIHADILKVLTTMATLKHSSNMNLFIPKFQFETDYSLNPTLSGMSISEIFTPAADLSGITGSRDLYVSLVKHKAVVKVDEEGTEAAAVTAISVRCTMLTPTTDFAADHPFLFLIKDKKTGLVLFIGKVESF